MVPDVQKCRCCGLLKRKIKGGLISHRRGYRYTDEHGNRWSGKTCYPCLLKNKVAYSRKNGVPDRSSSRPGTTTRKGWDAECLAASHLRSMGFSVKMNEMVRGPDLLVEFCDQVLTCEVKLASEHRLVPDSYFINRIYPLRLGDDLLAIVFPSGLVKIEAMQTHLSKTPKSGVRYLGRSL